MILAWLRRFNLEGVTFKKKKFHPPEVVSRYRDPQLQVGENLKYFFHILFICDHKLVNIDV